MYLESEFCIYHPNFWFIIMFKSPAVAVLNAANITFTSPLESNPSNWFNSSNIVLCISLSPPELDSYLLNKREGKHFFGFKNLPGIFKEFEKMMEINAKLYYLNFLI